MSASIDTAALRVLALKELPSEFKALRLKSSDESTTEQLLAAIELGSISTAVFSVWIGVCKSPVVVRRSLQQKISVHVRHLGIEQLGIGLGGSNWEPLWDGLGGTAGLLEIFSDLSVVEIRAACKAIGRCTSNEDFASQNAGADSTRKRERVTELFQSLHPGAFPDAVIKSRDMRPLTKYYQTLVPSCTAELVNWISSPEQKGKWQHVKERELLKHHSRTLGQAALHAVFESQSPDIKSKNRLRDLSTQFPSIGTSRHGFSASMSFALSLLRRVVVTDTKEVEDHWVVRHLVRPLLSRAIRKRVAWSQTQEIVDLGLQFFEHHPEARKTLKCAKRGLVHMVAICWSRRSSLFEAQLKRLLSIVFEKKASFEDLACLLVGVPRSRRYALLHFCCQEVMGVDLESESDLSRARGILPCNTLHDMEPSQALGLFKRLRLARGDTNLVSLGSHSSVLGTRRVPAGRDGDPDINYLVLLDRNGLRKEAEAYAANILEVRKKVTQTSASREARAENAIYVWAYANASGSLKLLHETLQWAKRFVRDQLTASRLFSTYYNETYQMLSGFLEVGNSTLKPQILRLRVEAANSFMADMLDVACLGLREPFFRASDWKNAIELFTRIIKKRIEMSAGVGKVMKASDDDMYEALWTDTIVMLLRVERLLNREEHKKLGAATISGVVAWASIFPKATHNKSRLLEKSTWKFIDALAEARDRLWAELRPTEYPDVLTLPTPFPRGLPLQHLLANWHPDVPDLERLAPYFSSRVQRTLFADPETALKPVVADEKLMRAIGCFVDSYQYALTAYVPRECEEQEQKSRFLRVWTYAIGPLSAQRMDKHEAIRFWKRLVPWYLQNALSEILPKEERLSWLPTIPIPDDPAQIEEWNPLEGRPADVKIKARRLDQSTYIDFCTAGQQIQHTKPTLGTFHKAPTPFIPMQDDAAPGIWSLSEASTLAALLYLDAKYSTTERLLPAPFPSARDVRFPCLLLDEEFLSLKEVKSSAAISYISRNLTEVPLPLVRKIVETIVGQFGAKDGSQDAAFSLLQALARGDRPGLAFPSIIKVIMKQPDTSSWHRILFNNGLLQRVPASDARAYISTYADLIAEKLSTFESNEKERTATELLEATSTANAYPVTKEAVPQSAKPLVKITTLKSLAQLLNGSTYIDDDFALGILLDLSRRVKHVDVRVSIIRTFLSKLELTRPELWDTVFSALETFLPLAGSLNEREPDIQIRLHAKSSSGSVRRTSDAHQDLRADELHRRGKEITTEEMYAELKPSFRSTPRESIVMPVMKVTTNSRWQNESPMLGALLDYFVTLEGGELWQSYMERIMVPLLNVLEVQTAKWTILFLEKYAPQGFDTSEAQMPPIAKGIQIYIEILSRPVSGSNRIPRQILDRISEYLVFRINPPAWIRTLNQCLEADPAWKTPSEVVTWLTLFGNDLSQSWSRPSSILPFQRIKNLGVDNNEGYSDYVTRSTYKNAFIEVFKELTWADGPRYDQLSALALTVRVGGSDDDGRATVEEMIAFVDSLRTKDWERNPKRVPAILPDTFGWRLKLLAWPHHSASDTDEAREISGKTIAQQLATIVNEISGSVYHTKLQQIQEQIKGKQNAVLTALHLGDISKTRLSWLTRPDILRVHLAAHMLLQSKGCSIGAIEGRVKELVETWITSEAEEVRRTGYSVREELFDANNDWVKSKSRR